MTDHEDFERRLRASLDQNAGRAPSGDGLTELIIAEATRGVTPLHSHRRSPRTWMLPLLAAAAVAAVLLSIVGISTWRTGNDAAPSPSQPALTHLPSTSLSTAPTATTPTTSATSATKPSASTQSSPLAGGAVATTSVTGFRLLDVTFYGTNTGWALGTADCLDGSGGTCPALLRTTDGVHWSGSYKVGFNVPGQTGGCAKACVDHIRFANASDGYAFGQKSLFITTNGGDTWKPLGGGATGLETLNHVVIRITGAADGADCAPCSVLTAPVGSADFTPGTLPAGLTDIRRLSFAGNLVLMAASRGSTDLLLTSGDSGKTWTSRGAVCRSGGIRQVSGAADGTVALDCVATQAGGGQQVTTMVSTNGAQSFAQRTAPRPSAADTGLAALSETVLLVSYDDALYRSSNGGRTWSQVATAALPGQVTQGDAGERLAGFLGSESPTDARWVPADRRTLFTTHTGGANWDSIAWSR